MIGQKSAQTRIVQIITDEMYSYTSDFQATGFSMKNVYRDASCTCDKINCINLKVHAP